MTSNDVPCSIPGNQSAQVRAGNQRAIGIHLHETWEHISIRIYRDCDHMMNKLSFSTAGKKISRYSRENQANICEVCK